MPSSQWCTCAYDQMNFHGPQAFDGWQGTSCDLLCGINWVEQRPEPRREVLVIRTRTLANTHWQTREHTLSFAGAMGRIGSQGVELGTTDTIFSGYQWIELDVCCCRWIAEDGTDAWFCSQPGAWLRNLIPENIYKKNVVNLLWKYFGCYDPASAIPAVQDRGKYEHESGIW